MKKLLLLLLLSVGFAFGQPGIAKSPAATPVGGGAANGSPVAGNPVLQGFSDGTNVRNAAGDSTGHLVPAGISSAAADGATNTPVLFNISGFGATVLDYRYGYNGSTWDKARTTSAATLSSATNIGASLSEKGPRWSVTNTPGASSKASASKAAGGASIRHVADCITLSAIAGVAPSLTSLTIDLRDGATGAGTILMTWGAEIAAATGQSVPMHTICGLGLVGSLNTAMTLEFSTLVTSVSETVTITGYDVN